MNVIEVINNIREMRDAAVGRMEFYSAAMLREITNAVVEANDKSREDAVIELQEIFFALQKSSRMIGALLEGLEESEKASEIS